VDTGTHPLTLLLPAPAAGGGLRRNRRQANGAVEGKGSGRRKLSLGAIWVVPVRQQPGR